MKKWYCISTDDSDKCCKILEKLNSEGVDNNNIKIIGSWKTSYEIFYFHTEKIKNYE